MRSTLPAKVFTGFPAGGRTTLPNEVRNHSQGLRLTGIGHDAGAVVRPAAFSAAGGADVAGSPERVVEVSSVRISRRRRAGQPVIVAREPSVFMGQNFDRPSMEPARPAAPATPEKMKTDVRLNTPFPFPEPEPFGTGHSAA